MTRQLKIAAQKHQTEGNAPTFLVIKSETGTENKRTGAKQYLRNLFLVIKKGKRTHISYNKIKKLFANPKKTFPIMFDTMCFVKKISFA